MSHVKLGTEQVNVIANLSALHVEESEVQQVAEKLSNILDLFAQLEAVDTVGVLPMSHPLDQVQRLREDVVCGTNIREKVQKIAPSVAEGLYLVPRVVD